MTRAAWTVWTLTVAGLMAFGVMRGEGIAIVILMTATGWVWLVAT